MTIRVGIVSTGVMAEHHAAVLRDAGAELVGVANPVRSRAVAFADRVDIPAAYDSAEDLYAHPGLDAVVIASPNVAHASQTITALRASLHVLTETPVGTSLADAETVARAAAQARRHAAVAHTLRFCLPCRRVRELVSSGRLEIRHIVARTLMLRQDDSGMPGRRRTWDRRRAMASRSAHGRCRAVAPRRARGWRRWDVSGWPEADGRWMPASCSARRTVVSPPSRLSYHSRVAARDLTIIAEDVTLQIDGPRLVSPDGVIVDCGSTSGMERVGLARQDEDFLIAIADGRSPGCTVEDVLPTMRVLDQLNGATQA